MQCRSHIIENQFDISNLGQNQGILCLTNSVLDPLTQSVFAHRPERLISDQRQILSSSMNNESSAQMIKFYDI